MKVLVTGAGGFLGWHTMARLRALTDHEVVAVTRQTWGSLADELRSADAVVHIAGVNRADDPEQVRLGNVRLAEDLATALRGAGRAVRLVNANSIQSGNGTPYGTGKQQAVRVVDMPVVTVRPSAEDMQQVAVQAGVLASQLASR